MRGASGTGKSSVLKCVAGAIPIIEGKIIIDGVELSPSTVSNIRTRIAFIGQEPIMGADIVREALLLPFTFKSHKGNDPTGNQILSLLDQLQLSPDIIEKPCAHISGGEKQRVAIARALLLGKDIFMADEITSALDPESKAAVISTLFKPEFTVLSVSHDADWIVSCDRIVEVSSVKIEEIQGEAKS